MNVKVPSDIDMADRVLWDLTARQLAILVAAGLCAWSAYVALATLSVVMAAAAATALAATGMAVAFARPDGVGAERWLLSAARHLGAPRRRVLAPEGLPRPPAWARESRRIGALELPLSSVSDKGVVTIEAGSFALVCRASALNLSLRSQPERQGLIEGLGRFLNSIDAPLAFVVRSERADLRGYVDDIERRAPGLPHRALEDAARSHARFLSTLAERRDVLRREVYVVFRAEAEDATQAGVRLLQRADEAATLLGGIGIALTPLSGEHVAALLRRACDPEGPLAPAQQSLPGDIVTGSSA
ncbi:MAG: PrgI family protein [Candidatus Limnocylindria bacterium]